MDAIAGERVRMMIKSVLCALSLWCVVGITCAWGAANDASPTTSTLLVHCGTSAATAAPVQPAPSAAATPIATPEPSTFALLGLGLAGVASLAARKRAR